MTNIYPNLASELKAQNLTFPKLAKNDWNGENNAVPPFVWGIRVETPRGVDHLWCFEPL